MPELPEVEITTRNLNAILKPIVTVQDFIFFRKDLRNKIPINEIKKLSGQSIHRIYRRAKFILFEINGSYILSHLGMTGSWRLEKKGFERRTHDHIILVINDDKQLVYNDPRRFGEFDLINEAKLIQRFKNFGPEPLNPYIDWSQVTRTFKKLKVSVKVALMNQKYIVGVGNIYANEALYRAGINPRRRASILTQDQYKRLWNEVQKVLEEAIRAGGSSIQDFRNGYGEKGGFQDRFLIYDREGQNCDRCENRIKALVLGGRATYWCSKCQN